MIFATFTGDIKLLASNSYAADIKPEVLVVVALRVDERRGEAQAVSVGSSTISSRRPPEAVAAILEGTRAKEASARKGEWESFQYLVFGSGGVVSRVNAIGTD